MKGKWAQGITPRHFTWVIKDRLAVCERPGGYGENHRRVRRQEEIIWIREQGFDRVVSLLSSPHNLHAYEEAGVEALHLPFASHDDAADALRRTYGQLDRLLDAGEKVVVHDDDLGDRLLGIMAGYLIHTGMVPEAPKAIMILERIVHRQIGPTGRSLVSAAAALGS